MAHELRSEMVKMAAICIFQRKGLGRTVDYLMREGWTQQEITALIELYTRVCDLVRSGRIG